MNFFARPEQRRWRCCLPLVKRAGSDAMPWDFHHQPPEEEGMAPYPADRPGWCEAIAPDEPRAPARPPAAPRALPDSEDLLGWSVLVLALPALAIGAVLLASQAALHLL